MLRNVCHTVIFRYFFFGAPSTVGRSKMRHARSFVMPLGKACCNTRAIINISPLALLFYFHWSLVFSSSFPYFSLPYVYILFGFLLHIYNVFHILPGWHIILFLFVCSFDCLFVWLFGCLVVWLYVWLIVWLFGCLFVCLVVCLVVCVLVCLLACFF